MAATMTFKYSKKQVYIAGACLVGALLWIGSSSNHDDASNHRRLDMDYHLSKMTEYNIVPFYETTELQYMSSPCRPEADGYFGSTSGTPLEIQFGFELETEDEENVEFLLEEIQEQMVDVVLSTTFPNLCGYRRRQERARHLSMRGLTTRESELKARPRTTGFKFAMDLDQRSDICDPTVDPTNLCGVYKSTIGIYGRHLSEIGEHLLSQVKEALNGEQERLSKDGLVRLTTLDSLTHQTGDYGNHPSGIHAMSFAAKAAIVVVIIALLAGIATFAAYLCLERQKQRHERPYMYHDKKKSVDSSNRTVGCEEASQVSETVGLRDGTAVVLEGGRPVVIEFEQESSKRQKDAIEEERSECGSTFFTQSVDASVSPQYISDVLRSPSEECKQPEDFQMDSRDLGGLEPPGAMTHSMASLSEYAEQTARSEGIRNPHEFT